MKLSSMQAYSSSRFVKLKKKVQNLYEEKKYDKIIDLLNIEILLAFTGKRASELFIRRGNAYEGLKKYEKAIHDYSTSLKYDPDNALAFYNRGTVNVILRNYDSALEDFEKAISKDDKFISAYISLASILRYKKKFNEAIDKLDVAIFKDATNANAYYNRGVAKMEGYSNWPDAIDDFNKFLELSPNDSWLEYANYYITYMEKRVNNKSIYDINRRVADIKNLLRITGIKVTHYTTLSALKELVFNESKFRLSEGNFLNDPSEGREFFNFLNSEQQIFPIPLNSDLLTGAKPFIGSFVVDSDKDDLNMWRFYGKENGIEASGCSITVDKSELINDVIDSIDKDDEGYNSLRDDIDFFYMAYYDKEGDTFLTSESVDRNKLLELLTELRDLLQSKYNDFTEEEKKIVEEDLISIAFLFKNIIYKNEQEVRILTNGAPFKKIIDIKSIPHKVYIELIPIKRHIEQIQFGPRSEDVLEWSASLNYAYEGQPPQLDRSMLPYK